jgi:hypothetical protein
MKIYRGSVPSRILMRISGTAGINKSTGLKRLAGKGTVIIKFFLHLSKNEQRKRFLERIDDPAKKQEILPVRY